MWEKIQAGRRGRMRWVVFGSRYSVQYVSMVRYTNGFGRNVFVFSPQTLESRNDKQVVLERRTSFITVIANVI